MGEGILKRRPSGWTPARAFAVQHRSRERNPNDEKTAVDLEVDWEVHVEGGAPYRFVESRRAPVSLIASMSVAASGGSRWVSSAVTG